MSPFKHTSIVSIVNLTKKKKKKKSQQLLQIQLCLTLQAHMSEEYLGGCHSTLTRAPLNVHIPHTIL